MMAGHYYRYLSEKRPWGKYEVFLNNEPGTVKLLYVNKGGRNSYQYHLHRQEYWRVVKGKIRATINGKVRIMREGDSVFIPRYAKHRLEGLVRNSVVLEVMRARNIFRLSFRPPMTKGSVALEAHRGRWNEDDVIRVEDDYGRA